MAGGAAGGGGQGAGVPAWVRVAGTEHWLAQGAKSLSRGVQQAAHLPHQLERVIVLYNRLSAFIRDIHVLAEPVVLGSRLGDVSTQLERAVSAPNRTHIFHCFPESGDQFRLREFYREVVLPALEAMPRGFCRPRHSRTQHRHMAPNESLEAMPQDSQHQHRGSKRSRRSPPPEGARTVRQQREEPRCLPGPPRRSPPQSADHQRPPAREAGSAEAAAEGGLPGSYEAHHRSASRRAMHRIKRHRRSSSQVEQHQPNSGQQRGRAAGLHQAEEDAQPREQLPAAVKGLGEGSLIEQLQAMQRERDEAREQLLAAGKGPKEASLTEQLQALQQERDEAREQLTAAAVKGPEEASLIEQLQALQRERDEAREQLSAANKGREEASLIEQLQAVQRERDDERAAKEAAGQKLWAALLERDSARDEIVAARKGAATELRKSFALTKEVERARADRDAAQGRFASLRRDAEQQQRGLAAEAEGARAERDAAQAQLDVVLTQHRSEREAAQRELREAKASAKAELAARESELRGLAERIKALRDEAQTAEGRRAAAEYELEAAVSQRESLETELATVKARLKASEEEFWAAKADAKQQLESAAEDAAQRAAERDSAMAELAAAYEKLRALEHQTSAPARGCDLTGEGQVPVMVSKQELRDVQDKLCSVVALGNALVGLLRLERPQLVSSAGPAGGAGHEPRVPNEAASWASQMGWGQEPLQAMQ